MNDLQISDPLVKQSVIIILKPDPLLADFMDYESRKESWGDIIQLGRCDQKHIILMLFVTCDRYLCVTIHTNFRVLIPSPYRFFHLCFFRVPL